MGVACVVNDNFHNCLPKRLAFIEVNRYVSHQMYVFICLRCMHKFAQRTATTTTTNLWFILCSPIACTFFYDSKSFYWYHAKIYCAYRMVHYTICPYNSTNITHFVSMWHKFLVADKDIFLESLFFQYFASIALYATRCIIYCVWGNDTTTSKACKLQIKKEIRKKWVKYSIVWLKNVCIVSHSLICNHDADSKLAKLER